MIQQQPFTGKVQRLEVMESLSSGKRLIWWYGRISKGINSRGNNKSEPEVQVFYRRISADGSLGIPTSKFVKIARLGALRVGSIWENGIQTHSAEMKNVLFDVEFSSDHWEVVSHHLSEKYNLAPPFQLKSYQLPSQCGQSYLLDFKLPNGKNLLVPCMEFFSRCFGRSQEVKRLLSISPWHNLKERLSQKINYSEYKNQWPVNISGRLVNDDATLLAHVLYDQHTQSVVKRIYAQIEAMYDQKLTKHTYLKVDPWFTGKASMRVKGHWLNNGCTFLGLDVRGMSEPSGNEIVRIRDRQPNINNLSSGAIDGDEALIPRKKIMDDGTPLISDGAQPDQDGTMLDILEDEFKILGKPRKCRTVQRDKENSKSRSFYIDDHAEDRYSTGEEQGSGKGVGKARISSKQTLESEGKLRDIWNAFIYLKNEHPGQIQSVEYYTFDHGFSDGDPMLIPLPGFSADIRAQLETKIVSWTYLASGKTRSILVIRVVINMQPIYIIEIERKLNDKNNDPSKEVKEECLTGFVFKLKNEDDLHDSVVAFRENIRGATGVVRRLIPKIVGQADVFKHVPIANEPVPSYSDAKRALSKMGVAFK